MSSRTSLTRPLAALAFGALLATPSGAAAFTGVAMAAAHVFNYVVVTPLIDEIGKSVTKPVAPAVTSGDTSQSTTAPIKGEHP